ncbi:MAG: ATP-binding protein [Prevotellaceae bacterium]|jgi:AAA15 family ATPase/GTPase|nr:ATP-binding protein [Prevotellaceae bacterium]
MIKEFTVGNFLSFKEKRTISFKAQSISDLPENKLIKFGKKKFLPSVVIYGANSSGKSNLITALQRMQKMVWLSVKLNPSDELNYSPFLLSDDGEKPTFFEIVFVIKEQCYKYGFEYNKTEIVKEWLFIQKSTSYKPLFLRTIEGIGVFDEFEEGKEKEKFTENNRLFISLVAQMGGNTSKQIMEWFEQFFVTTGLDNKYVEDFTIEMFHKNLAGIKESLQLYEKLQLGFNEIETVENKDGDKKKIITLNTKHNVYDNKGKVVGKISWNKDKHESEGTKKIIGLSGVIFDILFNSKMLIIDELDAKLHPLITMQIVDLFNNPTTNPNGAQLLFATHDTNLLSNEIFRRDQVWFTEKDEIEQTDLYSLYSFHFPDGTRIRNDANLEKNYIRGRYGAIPYITNY